MTRDRSPSAVPDGVELAAGTLTIAYNAVLNRTLPPATHVPANLLVSGALLELARRAGCDAGDLGLEPTELRRGVVFGGGAAVVSAAVLAGALVHPRTRPHFVEERDEGSEEAAYHALVRIPVGTALAEELVFRGALLAILARRRPAWQAAMVSSVLFGVWHVLPTHDSLDRHRASREVWRDSSARTAAVVGTVGVTTIAGLALSWLRLRSRSIVAPVLAHATVNVVAYLGGRWVARRYP